MITNISSLMSLVAEEERNLNILFRQIQQHAYTITTKELDGKENVIEDSKEDFMAEYEQYNNLVDKISKIKKVIYQKNNEFKLPDGTTIQEALVDVGMLRKKYTLYTQLNEYKNSNRRITEVNNSYFECKSLNFDSKQLKAEIEILKNKIQEIDFEISKLNSIEFDVEI